MSGAFEGKQERLPGPERLTSPEQEQGSEFLSGLLRDPNSPLLQIAGLTDIEQQGQGLLAQLASGELFQNPIDSPTYAPMREEFSRLMGEGLSGVSRQLQRSGAGGNTRGSVPLGNVANRLQNAMQSQLGNMYQQERALTGPMAALSAISQYGGLPRQIEQQRNQAAYQQQAGNLGMQQNIANRFLDFAPFYQPQFVERPSAFGQIASFAAPIAGAALGGPIGGAIGSAIAGGLGGGAGSGTSPLPAISRAAHQNIGDWNWGA